MGIKIIEDANLMVPTLNKLLKDNEDIWENDPHYQGYGFKVIREKKWVKVWMNYNDDKPSTFIISCYERNGNIFDSFTNKELQRKEIENSKLLYETIKGMLD